MAYLAAADGIKIYYEEYGKEHEKSIVMVPGHGGTIEFFRRNIPAIAEKYHVVAYDMRGHGKSDRINRHLTIDRCSEDLKTLIEVCGLEKPVLLGWSMGSNINMSYVMKYGCEKISGIIVVDNSNKMINDEEWKLGAWNDYEGAMAYLEGLVQTGWKQYAEASAPMFFGEGEIDPDDLEWVKKAYADETIECMLPIVMTNIFSSYKEALPLITVPTLIFCGLRKSFYDPSIMYGIAERIQDAAVVGLDGGHIMFFQDADRFNRAVIDFMENGTASFKNGQ